MPSAQRSTLHGAGEPGCELDPGSLGKPPLARRGGDPSTLARFHVYQRPPPAVQVWRIADGSHVRTCCRAGPAQEPALAKAGETVVACVRLMVGRKAVRECRTFGTTTTA